MMTWSGCWCRGGLAGVQVVAADLAEENLAFHAEAAAGRRRVLPASIRRATIFNCGLKVEVKAVPPVGGVILAGKAAFQ